MKKHILFLGFLLIVFGLRIDAQTLKNIHRHNQPVLRIPTHLIDKVETADVQGTPHLRAIQLNGYVSEIPLAQIDSITHSDGEAVDPAQLGNLRTASVTGVVRDQNNQPLFDCIVRSPYGGEETRTDLNGVFFLNNILVYDKLGYITITKPGFHQGSRSFLPLESGSNRVNVQLLPMTQSGSFYGGIGGTVSSGPLNITFPANAFVTENNQSYAGLVKVFAEALDPTSNSMFDQMPGELLGAMNDSLRLLRSFGMANIELRDLNDNELQLAPGATATLRFVIPQSMLSEAPQTIDWWSFDEMQGIWKHEGIAQRQGSFYIGQAPHFSWWNCDRPEEFNDLLGTVNASNGSPISDALVNVVTQTMGSGVSYTNSNGEFSGRVPKNQQLTIKTYLTCSSTSDWALAYSEILPSGSQALIDTITATLDGRYPLTGVLVECNNLPVENGYVEFGTNLYFTNQGQFNIQTCAPDTYIIRGFEAINFDSLHASSYQTIYVGNEGADAGIIQTCTHQFGTVSDFDNNVYPTVFIGNQIWMTKNYRSSHYANGDLIPNISDSQQQWQMQTEGAWCANENLPANELIYGKLYNWYTAVDDRNLCPTGWHVPSDAEWNILIEELDPSYNPETLSIQSSIAGGKLKSVTGWNAPNAGATNESNFQGLPGGGRGELGFTTPGNSGTWWTSTESNLVGALIRSLNKDTGNVNRGGDYKWNGKSVRCIKN
jgi:uncharacterized protein (TIGR02145 family)